MEPKENEFDSSTEMVLFTLMLQKKKDPEYRKENESTPLRYK